MKCMDQLFSGYLTIILMQHQALNLTPKMYAEKTLKIERMERMGREIEGQKQVTTMTRTYLDLLILGLAAEAMMKIIWLTMMNRLLHFLLHLAQDLLL